MSKIKFWPDVVAKTLDVEVETDSVRVRFTLDLEEAYYTIDDLQNAILIVERSFPDILHNGVGN